MPGASKYRIQLACLSCVPKVRGEEPGKPSQDRLKRYPIFGLPSSGKTAIVNFWRDSFNGENRTEGDRNQVHLRIHRKRRLKHIFRRKHKHLGHKLIIEEVPSTIEHRTNWPSYCHGIGGLFFVVDSSCPEQIQLASEEFQCIIRKLDPPGLPIIFLHHKQDIRDGKLSDANTIMTIFKLFNLKNKWQLIPSSNNGQGLLEAINKMYRLSKRFFRYPDLRLTNEEKYWDYSAESSSEWEE